MYMSYQPKYINKHTVCTYLIQVFWNLTSYVNYIVKTLLLQKEGEEVELTKIYKVGRVYFNDRQFILKLKH